MFRRYLKDSLRRTTDAPPAGDDSLRDNRTREGRFAVRPIGNVDRPRGDPITVIALAIRLVVIFVASVASWLPDRHAASVDPALALRVD
jgi:hypothetical protein